MSRGTELCIVLDSERGLTEHLQRRIWKGRKISIGEQYFPYKIKSNKNVDPPLIYATGEECSIPQARERHISGQACFAVSRIISYASVGEPGTLQLRADNKCNNIVK